MRHHEWLAIRPVISRYVVKTSYLTMETPVHEAQTMTMKRPIALLMHVACLDVLTDTETRTNKGPQTTAPLPAAEPD